MSYPVNVPIVCTVTVTTLDGVEPTNVQLTVTSPSNVTTTIDIVGITPRPNGSWCYRGFFVPNAAGTWVREWAAGNVLTTSVAPLEVV